MPQTHLYDLDENDVGVCRHLVPGFNHKICGTIIIYELAGIRSETVSTSKLRPSVFPAH
jgi:hypothetical protein